MSCSLVTDEAVDVEEVVDELSVMLDEVVDVDGVLVELMESDVIVEELDSDSDSEEEVVNSGADVGAEVLLLFSAAGVFESEAWLYWTCSF